MQTVVRGLAFALWVCVGAVASAQPPSAISVTPSSGIGFAATFRASFADPNGSGQIGFAELSFDSSSDKGAACVVILKFGALYLLSDRGDSLLGPLILGSDDSLANGQCAIAGKGARIDAGSTVMTLSVPITFGSSFVGLKEVHLYASDSVTGLNSGWQQLGSWTVGTSVPLSISSGSQLATGTFPREYSQALAAAGGTPPYRWDVAARQLPQGLSLSSSGVLSGKPAAQGTYTFTLQVTTAALRSR